MSLEQERSALQVYDTWDLSLLYESDASWQLSKDAVVKKGEDIASFQGTLGRDAGTLFACLELQSSVSKEFSRLWSYAFMKADEDTRVSDYLSMKQELSQAISVFHAQASYIDPEVTAISEETIAQFCGDESGLRVYTRYFQEIQRQKQHTLSEPEEKILAQIGPLARNPYSTFEILSYADLPYPDVTLANGETVRLDQSTFSKYRSTHIREDRIAVFETFFDSLNSFKRTFAVGLYGTVQKDVFFSRTRKYSSCLEAALDSFNIPTSVYHALVDNVRNNLDTFHRYLQLKKELINVDTFLYSDVYAPIDMDGEIEYSLGQAKDMVKEACGCLGEHYVAMLEKAYASRWIDFCPNAGKTSGAYSNGGAYDVHPYILMNYNGKYDDVSTLAHELGHTMHSYFSNTNQPFQTSDYSIFVAEVASTVNEILLMKKQLEKIESPKKRKTFLMHFLDHFKGTVFRQTQFAEFELAIHEEGEAGKSLTDDRLAEIYKGIFEAYYGINEGVTEVDERFFSEWAFVPHFYYNFYVYQYATSFTASVVLAEKIFQGEEGIVDKYISFLSSGSVKDPIDLLADVGVDMRSADPFNAMIGVMNNLMDEVSSPG